MDGIKTILGKISFVMLYFVYVANSQMGGMNNNMNMTNNMHNNMSHDMNMTHNMHNNMSHDMNMTHNMHDMNMTHNMTHGMHNMTGHGGMDHGDKDHGGMDHGDMDHGNMDHGGMDHSGGHPLYFYFSTNETILFREWVTYSEQTIGLSCLYVVLIAIFYEGLKVFRDFLYRYERRKDGSRQEKYSFDQSNSSCCSCFAFCFHIFQTLLHMIQVFMSLCLMLVFMTFNVYLCIAVVGGAGVGYLIFGWNRSKAEDPNDHCN